MAELNANDSNESITLCFNALKTSCNNNAAYFSTDDSEGGKRLNAAFQNIIQYANAIEPQVKEINTIAKDYDYDEKCKGNGFRSFVSVVSSSVKYTIQVSHKVCVKRDNLWFRKNNVIRDVESCSELLSTIDTSMKHVMTVKNWCTPGELFVPNEHSAQELLSMAENINQYCFYGRSLGFQYCDSMKTILKFLSLTMAIFSEAYYNDGSFLYKATNSVWTSGKYFLDPDMRARRIVNISQNADVDFCKAYWSLAESQFMMSLPPILSSSVAVSHVITLPPETLQYVRDDATVLEIPSPTVHIGLKALSVRLISHVARVGMVGAATAGRGGACNQPKSTKLLVHCHGGGFVAQSSKSHEIYLRDWAHHLNTPILSVDYSLAPEAPFPRAIEEVFYAYCWAVNNCELLGSTGENIILAGDSAGGNLCVGVAIKCIEYGMRPPDGLFLAYVPLWVEFNPSPSRLLCYMDPLLPFGFMMRCLKAYACTDHLPTSKSDLNPNQNGGLSSSDTESFEEVSESDLLELQAHKSPISETSDTLTNVSLSSQPMSTSSKPSANNTENKTYAAGNKEESEKYVADFLEKYVLESDTDTDGAKVTVEKQEQTNASRAMLDVSLQQRFTGFLSALTSKITRWKNKKNVSPAELYLDGDRQKSLQEEFIFTVPKNHYLSPYFAKDEILAKMPPVRILTVELDPCLDDCVMFAKKLKNLKTNVDLDVLVGLPHGFLNFAAMCKEAHQGSKKCIERMNELLNMKSQHQLASK